MLQATPCETNLLVNRDFYLCSKILCRIYWNLNLGLVTGSGWWILFDCHQVHLCFQWASLLIYTNTIHQYKAYTRYKLCLRYLLISDATILGLHTTSSIIYFQTWVKFIKLIYTRLLVVCLYVLLNPHSLPLLTYLQLSLLSAYTTISIPISK